MKEKTQKKRKRHTTTSMCMVEHQLTDSCSRVQYDLVPLLRLVKIWFWSQAYQSSDFRAHMSDAGNANRWWCRDTSSKTWNPKFQIHTGCLHRKFTTTIDQGMLCMRESVEILVWRAKLRPWRAGIRIDGFLFAMSDSIPSNHIRW